MQGSVSSRVRSALQKYGVMQFLWRGATKPFRSAWRWGQHRFNEGSYVWRFDPKANVPPRYIEGLRCTQYARLLDIPDKVFSAMARETRVSEEMLNWTKTGIDTGRMRIWIAELDDDIVAVFFSQIPKDMNEWFIRLQPGDVVLFAQRTFEPFRGRGIGPTFLRMVSMQLANSGATVHIDCSIHNKASIRSIEKAGFQNRGRFSPLKKRSVQLH